MDERQEELPFGDESNNDKTSERWHDLMIEILREEETTLKPYIREKYKAKISNLIAHWNPESRPVNFVHELIGTTIVHDAEDTPVALKDSHKKLLLEIAVSEHFEQLEFRDNENKGFTALHRAIEIDCSIQQRRPQIKVHAHPRFTLLFCDLIKQGVKEKRLSMERAAEIVSKQSLEGETCLHMALARDLEDVCSLIELADDATMKQQRINGNTPLHDALDFFIERATQRPRYSIAAPICQSAMLKKEPGPQSTNQPTVDFNKQIDYCNTCRAIDKTYQDIKNTRFRIILALVRKCPSALAIHNEAGKPPLGYHVACREEFRKRYPQWDMNVKKSQRKSTRQPNIILPTFGSPGIIGPAPRPGGDEGLVRRMSTLAKGEPQLANVGSLRAPESQNIESGPRTTAQQGKGLQNCPPNAPRDFYRLSSEIEELLWEEAFQVGGYEEARFCLYSTNGAARNQEVAGVSQNEELHEVFKPTRRLTTSTRKQYQFFRFAPTLAYVHLKVTPDDGLDDKRRPVTDKERIEWRKQSSRALEMLFKWLKKSKRVRRILKLVVEDNDEFPTSELVIQDCLNQVEDIRYLDWRRPNISVQTLMKAKDLVELWLYSTGINAVLSSWADQGGLRRLAKLRVVHIDAKPGMESDEANKTQVEGFKSRLQIWYNKPSVAPKVDVKYRDINSAGSNVAEGRSVIDANEPNSWHGKLRKLSQSLSNTYLAMDNDEDDLETEEESKSMADYVKVALLDDGVDPEYYNMGMFMSGDGWPRPTEVFGQNSFYSSGNMKHGNQMAKLITLACPFTRLYVAKLDVQEEQMTPKHPTFQVAQAIKAIEWAIEKKVDVISMSWNVILDEDNERKLEDVIRKAHRADILLFCAASEVKTTSSESDVWPTSCKETISIGAANEHRQAQSYVGNDARFLLPSEIDGKDGGSSAATALAAGLASLILYCLKMRKRQNEEIDSDRKGAEGKQGPRRKQSSSRTPSKMIATVFGRLTEEGQKYVDIDALLGKDSISYNTVTKLCGGFLDDVEYGPGKKPPLRSTDGRI